MGFAALDLDRNRDVGAERMGFAALYPSYALLGFLAPNLLPVIIWNSHEYRD
ncbi:hypothetical protein ThimaDRAFT_0357 [Thiocapsa marina 5811]|uniref:Uncharacterized protein n=1 Tax=Thiocapsa marina 5811 TaxID=768671 RepID=F9U606_9GAMM|nr:hypothetical protein ThimaDRAFT_0357 [Thiocapsa marina 5811]